MTQTKDQVAVAGKQSLSQQLYDAYVASLRQSEAEVHECSSDGRGVHTVHYEKKEEEPAKTLSLVDHGKLMPASSGANAVDDKKLAKRAASLYRLNASTLEAWNQIGDLANDVSHSAIVRQAEIINEIAHRDDRIQREEAFEHREQQRQYKEIPAALIRKRKFEEAVEVENNHKIKKAVVSGSSEEEDPDDATSDEETVAVSSLSSSTTSEGDDLLGQHVERMIRMTNYVAEMERIHALFRTEMEALAGNQEE